jgi:hypothetical protein
MDEVSLNDENEDMTEIPALANVKYVFIPRGKSGFLDFKSENTNRE